MPRHVHVHLHTDDYGPGQNPASHSHHGVGERTVGGGTHVATPHQIASHGHLEKAGYKHTMTSNAGTRHYWAGHKNGRYGIAVNKRGGWNGFNQHGHEGQGSGEKSLQAHLAKPAKTQDRRSIAARLDSLKMRRTGTHGDERVCDCDK